MSDGSQRRAAELSDAETVASAFLRSFKYQEYQAPGLRFFSASLILC